MDKNLIGAALIVPVLFFSGGVGRGPSCNYTKPELVFAKACKDDACRAEVRRHLPSCQAKLAGDLTTSIRYDGGVAKAPHLSLATMDKLTDCIAASGFGTFHRGSLDLSRFTEVSKDVRSSEFRNVTGDCKGKKCSGVFMRPVVGKTTFLYGPA